MGLLLKNGMKARKGKWRLNQNQKKWKEIPKYCKFIGFLLQTTGWRQRKEHVNNINQNVGSGMIGEISEPLNEMEFLKNLKIKLKTDCIRYTSLLNNEIKKVALCGGSGRFLLNAAKHSGADVFITSDFKYHEFFDAENRILIADIGHYESEQYTMDLIADFLRKNFPKFAIHLSKVNTNPINYL